MKFILSIIALFIAATTCSQDLLVNGGFEDINICTEYQVECAPEAWISSTNGLANYYKEARRAHSGNNCMAIEAGNFKTPYRRTFIRSRLVCGLRKGSRYLLQFYIKSWHEVLDSVGVKFSGKDPLFERVSLQKQVPSFYLHEAVAPLHINDSSWHKISVTYTATGEEIFIALGYYGRDDYIGELAHPLENRYYVYFDDISLVPLEPNEKLCAGWEQVRQEIYDENERHSLLEKKIKYYSLNPPPVMTIVKTTVQVIDTLVIPDILFASGNAVLQPQSFLVLDSFCRKMKSVFVDSVVIEGHTDSVGDYQYNQQLSVDRATTVKNYLQSKTGYPSIMARGWAFLKPVADNRTPIGRQKNRRVEVFLYIRD